MPTKAVANKMTNKVIPRVIANLLNTKRYKYRVEDILEVGRLNHIYNKVNISLKTLYFVANISCSDEYEMAAGCLKLYLLIKKLGRLCLGEFKNGILKHLWC